MATKPYLIFSLHDTRYAIAAEQVAEIFLLPELTPVANAPFDIVGLFKFAFGIYSSDAPRFAFRSQI